MRERVIVAAVGVPLIFCTLWLFPPTVLPIAISLLSMIASVEMMRALQLHGWSVRICTILFAGAVPLWVYFGEDRMLALGGLLLYVLLVFISAMASGCRVQVSRMGASFFFAFLIPLFLSSVTRIAALPLRNCYILIPIMIPFLSDVFAMFGGMLFGKHKLVPRLSPKKTVEGCISGIVGAALCALLYGFILSLIFPNVTTHYAVLLLYGLLGSVIAQLGDLSFSYVKRQTKLKDFGSIFPGHGGVLDRFDSVIFCAPFLELLIHLLPAFSSLTGAG